MWKDGFLAKELDGVVALAHSNNSELFSQLGRVNENALSLLRQIEVLPDDVHGLLVAVFYSRTIDSVEAAILLAERGLPTQAKALLRVAMESLFSLRASLDENFANKLIDADSVKRKKHFRKAAQLVERNLMLDPRGRVSPAKLAEIEAEIAATNAKDITTADIAKAAGLEDWYLGIYALFSSSVHSTVRDLERHFLVDGDGEIAALINEPDTSDCAGILICAIEQLLMAFTAAADHFGFEYVDFWSTEHEALRLHVEAEQSKSVDGHTRSS
jgi:hypothetical protein